MSQARKAYDYICYQLKALDISSSEIRIAFSNALITILEKVSEFFPCDVNCLELSLDIISFYAHMDVDY